MALPLILGITSGASIAVKPSHRLAVLTAGALFMILNFRGVFSEKLLMRAETYYITLQASMEHPWIGQGQNPLAEPIMLQRKKAPLPSIHSSWLSLLFHHGLLAVLMVVLGVWQAATLTRSRLFRGVLLGISVIGIFDDILRWPGLLVIGVWILIGIYQEAFDEKV